MSVFTKDRENRLSFFYKDIDKSGYFEMSTNLKNDRIYTCCKESFVWYFGSGEYDVTDFCFNFITRDRLNNFVNIFSKFCKEKKIKIKLETSDNSLRIESDFWLDNLIHLDLLACLFKEINRVHGPIGTIEELFSRDNLQYFQNKNVKNLFLNIKSAIKALELTKKDNAFLFPKLFSFGSNGLISFIQNNYKKSLTFAENKVPVCS